MSSVTNIVLQVGSSEQALAENINLILEAANEGALYKVDSKVPGSRKHLEVGVYLKTLNGLEGLADQIANCVREYQEEIPEDRETVLILTRDGQSSELIRPGS